MQDTPDTTKKMSAEDCWARLQANNLGRLVLTDGNFVDVLPVLYGVADHEIYLRTTRGDRFSVRHYESGHLMQWVRIVPRKVYGREYPLLPAQGEGYFPYN